MFLSLGKSAHQIYDQPMLVSLTHCSYTDIGTYRSRVDIGHKMTEMGAQYKNGCLPLVRKFDRVHCPASRLFSAATKQMMRK